MVMQVSLMVSLQDMMKKMAKAASNVTARRAMVVSGNEERVELLMTEHGGL